MEHQNESGSQLQAAAPSDLQQIKALALADAEIDGMWRDATEHGGDTTQAFVRYFARLIEAPLIARIERAAAPAPTAEDLGVLGEQAEAWRAVVVALSAIRPEWHSLAETGMDSAVTMIRELANSASSAKGGA